MRINVTSNFPEVAARLQSLGRRAPGVANTSLTLTARDGQAAIKAEKARVFDRPTKYALNSTIVKTSAKDLEASILVKDDIWGKGTPANRFLGPQIFGGDRSQKGMERMLERARLMPYGWFAVPGAGAQLDGNGNVKRSQIVQILSQLKLQRGAGFESRASGSTRSNRTIARQGVTYFALATVRRGLQPGIYMKRKVAMGTTVKPVFLFVSAVQYRKRLRFHEVGEATVRARFPVHFRAEAAKAVAAARLR